MSLDWIAPFRFSSPTADAKVVVEGDLPKDLRGRLLRTTPGGLERGAWRASHWFDGLCMLYRFDLSDTPTFRSAWLDSEYLRQVDAGQISRASFGTRRNPGFWQWIVRPIPEQSDNCNVNVMRLGERYLALTETNQTLEIDPETLAVNGLFPWSGDVPRMSMHLAHPRFHGGRGEVITLCSKLGPTSTIRVATVSPAGERTTLGSWKTRRWPYLHDFGLTDRYAVVIAHDYTLAPTSMPWTKRGILDHMMAKGAPMRLVVLPLDGGDARIFETDPGFVFHLFNSHERDGEIVMDLVVHGGADVLTRLSVDTLLDGRPNLGGTPTRFRLNLRDGTMKREVLADVPCEFPQIHYRRAHQKDYRFGYAVSTQVVGKQDARRYESRVVKLELDGGEVGTYEEPDYLPGEALFVAGADADGSSAEDDGYLLTVAPHRSENETQLWILDARDLSMRARLTVDTVIPLGFHGQFYRSTN